MNMEDLVALLSRLEEQNADSLESQELDFKEWPATLRDALDKVVEMAVCMANGGGGFVVFGVRDKVVGRKPALIGVPSSVEPTALQRAVYDRTDPRLTPHFHVVSIPEGTGRLIAMEVFPGMPPYTDSSGTAKIRVGKECQPLTGSHRQSLLASTGHSDWSAKEIPRDPHHLLSSAALESLKAAAARQGLPSETLQLSPIEFLTSIGVIRNGRLTNAGLLLAGSDDALADFVPNHIWTYLRLAASETDYALREDGRSSLGLCLPRLEELVRADNPAMTVKDGLLHFEYKTWPEEALREALMNALCHRDYTIGGPVVVKQGAQLLSLANPGGFIGGVTPENVLHHTPVTRNPHLVNVLVTLRLVNRSNVGVKRMYRALLVEGKEPPHFEATPDSVTVRFTRSDLSASFRAFISRESEKGRDFRVEDLLILQKLMHVPHLTTKEASNLIQRPESGAVAILSLLEIQRGYLVRTAAGPNVTWELSRELRALLTPRRAAPIESKREDWKADASALEEAALAALKSAKTAGKAGSSNKDLREALGLSRDEVLALMHRLMERYPHVRMTGKRGRGALFMIDE